MCCFCMCAWLIHIAESTLLKGGFKICIVVMVCMTLVYRNFEVELSGAVCMSMV